MSSSLACRHITHPNQLKALAADVKLGILGIDSPSSAAPTNKSTNPNLWEGAEVILSVLQPLAHASSRDWTLSAKPYINIDYLGFIWNESLCLLPPVGSITFDLTLPVLHVPSTNTNPIPTRIHWCNSSPYEEGIGLEPTGVGYLVLKMAMLISSRISGPVDFHITHNGGGSVAERIVAWLMPQFSRISTRPCRLDRQPHLHYKEPQSLDQQLSRINAGSLARDDSLQSRGVQAWTNTIHEAAGSGRAAKGSPYPKPRPTIKSDMGNLSQNTAKAQRSYLKKDASRRESDPGGRRINPRDLYTMNALMPPPSEAYRTPKTSCHEAQAEVLAGVEELAQESRTKNLTTARQLDPGVPDDYEMVERHQISDAWEFL